MYKRIDLGFLRLQCSSSAETLKSRKQRREELTAKREARREERAQVRAQVRHVVADLLTVKNGDLAFKPTTMVVQPSRMVISARTLGI